MGGIIRRHIGARRGSRTDRDTADGPSADPERPLSAAREWSLAVAMLGPNADAVTYGEEPVPLHTGRRWGGGASGSRPSRTGRRGAGDGRHLGRPRPAPSPGGTRTGRPMTARVPAGDRRVPLWPGLPVTWLILEEGPHWQRVMWHPALDDHSGRIPALSAPQP